MASGVLFVLTLFTMTKTSRNISMRKKSQSTTVKEAGNMIASQPYNPDKRVGFGDLLVRELDRMLQAKSLTPVQYSMGVDFVKINEKPITHIYAGKPHALRHALMFVLSYLRS